MIYSDNGILATVPGNYIGAALNQCPDPRTARADVHQVVVDASWAGRVLITKVTFNSSRQGGMVSSVERTEQGDGSTADVALANALGLP